jgi:membrane-associated phospholipid phosphatase
LLVPIVNSTVEGRLLTINWCVVSAAAALLVIVLAKSDFVLRASDPIVIIMAGLASTLAPLSFALLWKGSARWPNVSHAANVLSQLIAASMLIAPLTYIAASLNYPLQDKNLFAIDHFMGLDWRSYLNTVDRYRLGDICNFGYRTFAWQPLLIPIVLCLFGKALRAYQFSLAFVLTVMATVVISVFLPASGAYTFLGLSPADYPHVHPADDFDHMRHLPLLREGKMRVLEIGQLTGIVTFPSFHAAGAILYLWALWAIRWMRAIALICNALLLLSTPIDGGHYFIDVVAGVSLAILSILAVRRLSCAFKRDLWRAALPTLR